MNSQAAVIVPVRGDGQDIASNLCMIVTAAAAEGAVTFVVDNGAGPTVRRVLDGLHGLELLVCSRPGSYRARNVGVRAALSSGCDPILFTDADCRPENRWPRHLVELVQRADIAVTVAAPRPDSVLGRGAEWDYRRRLALWAGGQLRCGRPVATMDTRAAAVAAHVFGDGLFTERLHFAGDAVFGRAALRRGYTVVGCDHTVLSHDPPTQWWTEYRKYRVIAATLVDELRDWPRADVLALLPEHAHLLLPPPANGVRDAKAELSAARRELDPASPESAGRLYAALRTLGWSLGWRDGHLERQRIATDARSERRPT